MPFKDFSLCPSSLPAVLAAMLLATCVPSVGQSEFLAYVFPDSGAVGCNPEGTLVADSAGNLYGTTQGCGGHFVGNVFELVRPVPPKKAWTETVLYYFHGGNDGGPPQAGVIFDRAGNLYGTTSEGGAFGRGTVYELSPPATAGAEWIETVLYSFRGGSSDGYYPFSSLVWDSAGNLYGTTAFGGLNHTGGCTGCGTIFQLAPPATPGGAWTETVIHYFNYTQGAIPESAVVLDAKGDLYGTVRGGGKYGYGLVYMLKPPAVPGEAWMYKALHAFSGSASATPDGAYPYGGLTIHGKGVLYGTTEIGGQSSYGTVFQLVPPVVANGAWTENILHNFSGSDGGEPAAELLFDSAGNVYGTTSLGSVFELTPPASEGAAWTETVLHLFSAGSNGSTANPSSGLIRARNGVLFGVTESGGNPAGNMGTVYGVVP